MPRFEGIADEELQVETRRVFCQGMAFDPLWSAFQAGWLGVPGLVLKHGRQVAQMLVSVPRDELPFVLGHLNFERSRT